MIISMTPEQTIVKCMLLCMSKKHWYMNKEPTWKIYKTQTVQITSAVTTLHMHT